MQKITPFLWFDQQAEEAATFYVSVFKNARVVGVVRYDKEAAARTGRPPGSAMAVNFELDGQAFVALNGGPHFKITEAVSFVVNCESQEEVDYFWDKLSESGDPNAQRCGWLKYKFGVSWQVVPTVLSKLLQDPDTRKSGNVMHALLQMSKIDIKSLEQAYGQR